MRVRLRLACSLLSNTINVDLNAAFATQPDSFDTNRGCQTEGTLKVEDHVTSVIVPRFLKQKLPI